MADIRAFAITLCAVSLGCTVLQLLMPKGSFGRLFSMVVAAFFLCSLLAPLSHLMNGETQSVPPTEMTLSEEELRNLYYKQLHQKTEETLSVRVKQILASYDVAVSKVELDMHISDDGDIYMRRIIVYLDKQNSSKATTVRTVLEQQLKLTVSVRQVS